MESGEIYAINEGENFGHMIVFLEDNKFFNTTTSEVVRIDLSELPIALNTIGRYGKPVLDFVEKLPDDVFEVIRNNADIRRAKPYKLIQRRGNDPYMTLQQNAYTKKGMTK